MNDRRTFIGAIIAFFVGLLLGQQEHGPRKLQTEANILKAERTGQIKILCESTRIQYDFPLESVFLDDDGAVKPLNEPRDSI